MCGIVSYFFPSTDKSVATEEQEFTWKIPEYITKKNQICLGTSWKSTPFSFKSNSATQFIFNFYPKSDNISRNGIPLDEVRKWTSIYLRSNCSSKCKDISSSASRIRDQNYHVELSILDANEKKCFTKTLHRTCSLLHAGSGYTRFVLQSELEDPANNLLPDGTLTLHCRIKKLNESSTVCLCPTDNLPKVRHFNRSSAFDFARYFNNEMAADFNFKVKNRVFPGHKIILAGRSPVFAAMFKHDMKEKETSEVEIEDMDPAVFQKMLKFIYTTECDVGEHAEELLMAADRYDVKDLKEFCEEELMSKLTVDNAVRMLILSDKCQAMMLKNATTQFINGNGKQVLLKNESSFDVLQQSAPHLLIDLYKNKLRMNP
jgi:BTB/POZ domain